MALEGAVLLLQVVSLNGGCTRGGCTTITTGVSKRGLYYYYDQCL